jgi:hypothetical protein
VTWAGLQAKVTRVLLDDHAGGVLVVVGGLPCAGGDLLWTSPGGDPQGDRRMP